MKMIYIILASVLLLTCLVGCGKNSALEGKLSEAKGKPIVGMKIVAKPVSGNKQLETITRADGTFKIEKLAADSEYELTPYSDSTTKLRTIKIVTAPEGQTKKLPEGESLVFYLPTKDGSLVRDSVSGLLWVRDASKAGKMNWNDAVKTAEQFSYAGYSDWRLPTRFELRALALYGGAIPAEKLNLEVFTNVQADKYWSSDLNEKNKEFAWAVNMTDGKPVNDSKKDFKYSVWLVRTDK